MLEIAMQPMTVAILEYTRAEREAAVIRLLPCFRVVVFMAWMSWSWSRRCP